MNADDISTNLRIGLLQKQGGGFVLRIHLLSQLISSLVGPFLGVYFIYITTHFSSKILNQFLFSIAITTLLVDVIHYFYAVSVSEKARSYLDSIFKNRPLPEGIEESDAWKEIVILPRRSAIAQIILIYIIIVIPVILFMHFFAKVNWNDVVYLAIGGSLAAIVVLILNFLFLDSQLAPARHALLPTDPALQNIQITVSQSARQYFVIVVVLLLATFSIGGISYKIIQALTSPGVHPIIVFSSYRNELIFMGTGIFIIGIFLAFQLANAVSKPTQEILRTMDVVQKGGSGERAQIITSDNMAHLTIRLNQMLERLESTHASLERQVRDRTVSLEQRNRQLQAAAQVAREAASLEDINNMLSRTVNLISEQFGFYHAGIFLLDDTGESAVLQAASSEGGKKMLARRHKLIVGQQGIVGAAAFLNRPRIAMDVDIDREFFDNPDLPLTRSEVAIPLTAQGRVIGVLDIQSTESSRFAAGDIEVLQILADQVALAIQNARLFSESQDAIKRLQAISGQNSISDWREQAHGMKNVYRYTSSGLVPVTKQTAQSVVDSSADGFLTFPISLRGQRIGNISVHRQGQNSWNDADRSLLSEITSQIALALENARLVQETQLKAEHEQTVSKVTARIRETLDIDMVLQTAVKEIKQTFDLEEAEVRLQLEDQPVQSEQPRKS